MLKQRWLFLGVVLLVLARDVAAAEPAIRVFCPAVNQDDYDEGYADVPRSKLPVAAIVVGSLDRKTMRLKVDRSLFGPKVAELALASDEPHLRDEGDPQIYCLSVTRHVWIPTDGQGTMRKGYGPEYKFIISPYFEHYRVFPLNQERDVAELARARLDVLVLGSKAIFVGRPANPVASATKKPADSDDGRTLPAVPITVERVLSGEASKFGKTVYANSPFDPYESASGSYVYFVDARDESKKKGVLSISRRWPDTEIPLVEETLKRRSLFPVRDGEQEIVFAGTVTEAIALMGGRQDAVQTLAARRLLSDSQEALPKLAAFVEAHLFSEPGEDLASYEHQLNLIKALGMMEQHRADGEIARLVTLMLDRIQGGAKFPQPSDADTRASWRSTRYWPTDANHSLLWLLLTLDEPDAARLFGPRLLDLRSRAAYGWREEIQEFINRGHLEDQLDLVKLRKRMTAIKPVTWSGAELKMGEKIYGHARPIKEVEYVDAGAALRTTSDYGVVCRWNATTGQAIDRIDSSPKKSNVADDDDLFAPPRRVASRRSDSREQGEPEIISGRKLRYNETELLSEDRQRWYLFKVTNAGGKYGPARAYAVEVGEVAQPTDKAKPSENAAIVTEPWWKLGGIDLKWGQDQPFGLVPDGQHLHFVTQIFRRDNLEFVSGANVAGSIDDFQFFPDGSRYLLRTSDRETRPGPLRDVQVSTAVLVRIRVHDTKTGRTLLMLELPGKGNYPTAISPDGKSLVVVRDDNKIEKWPIPRE